MVSLENNRTWPILQLVNATGNNTEELGESSARRGTNPAQVILILISISGILVNAISILALSKSKRLRNATTAFIVNLCVADFLYSVLQSIYFINPTLERNPVFCRWFPMCRYLTGSESLNSMIVIAVNRYICVAHPSRYNSIYRKQYVALMIFFTWLYCVVFSVPTYFGLWGRYGYDPKMVVCSALMVNGQSPITYFYTSILLYPLLAFLFCYPRIFWIVHTSSKRLNNYKIRSSSAVASNATTYSLEKIDGNNDGNLEISSVNLSKKQYQKELKVLKVMLVVLVGFAICWYPLAILKLLKREDLRGFLVFSIIMVSLSNVINPIIYIVMSSGYRRAYKELFQCERTSTDSTSGRQT